MVVRKNITMITQYRWGTSSTSPDWNFKITSDSKKNLKSVWKCSCCTSRSTLRTWWWGRTSPWSPCTGEVHQVQVQIEILKLFLILKKLKSVWKCSCCTSRCTWRTWWWGRSSPWSPSTGEVHHVQVQIEIIKLFLILKKLKSVWKCSCCTSRCTWRTWWWGGTSCWGQMWIYKDYCYCYCNITL